MIISCQWLGDFVDFSVLEIEVTEIAKSLTMIGLNVEAITEKNGHCVFDIEVTSNRPDCLSHRGIAREISAHFGLRLKQPDLSEPQNQEHQPPIFSSSVAINDPELCPRYSARFMMGLKVGESPAWLRRRLEEVGQRTVNNVVDITNYVMLELGHPLHAFDYQKMQGGNIVIRAAKPGETLVTLDGFQRRLDPSMLAICDSERPIGLAGIMGGRESEVSESTRSILLESAYFRPETIRDTSRKLGLRTEASFRFERGADPQLTVQALNRATRLIQEICGGFFVGSVIDEYPLHQSLISLRLRSDRILKVTGLSIDQDFITETLRRLEFDISQQRDGVWEIHPPSFRVDISVEEDLVEEVVRHYGYDRLETTHLTNSGLGKFLPTSGHDIIITRTLEGLGFFEAFNYVFTNPSREKVFWDSSRPMVAISNPLTDEDTHLRTSLLPGLIDSLRRNLNHGNANIRLFELGKVFHPGSETGSIIEEVPRLAMVATGEFYRSFQGSWTDKFSFHHLKGVLDVLVEKFDRELNYTQASDISCLHPGIAAQVYSQGELLGVLGELHPRLIEVYGIRQTVVVAEFNLDKIYAYPLQEPQYKSFGKFPSSERDLSFLFDKNEEYGRILSVIKGLKISDLQAIKLVDLYFGRNLPSGKASLTIRLVFANAERTLTQGEVSRHTEAILSVLQAKFSVEVRS